MDGQGRRDPSVVIVAVEKLVNTRWHHEVTNGKAGGGRYNRSDSLNGVGGMKSTDEARHVFSSPIGEDRSIA
jgi:hypothetical protein